MNLGALIKIGVKNVTQHKKRSALTVIILSALLTLVFFINICATGPIRVIKEYADKMSGGSTYVLVSGQSGAISDDESEAKQKVMADAKKYHADFEFSLREISIKTKLDTFEDEDAEETSYVAAKNPSDESLSAEAGEGGEDGEGEEDGENQAEDEVAEDIADDSAQYSTISATVISLESLKKLTDISEVNATEDAISVVINFGTAARVYTKLKNENLQTNEVYAYSSTANYTKERADEIISAVAGKTITLGEDQDRKYFVLGVVPGAVSYSLGKSGKGGVYNSNEFNVLDLFLSGIVYQPTNLPDKYIVDDGSPATSAFINSAASTQYNIVTSFESADDAVAFYEVFASRDDDARPKYSMVDFWGNQFSVTLKHGEFWTFIDKAVTILLAALFVILFAALLRIVVEEVQSIALYQSLGASPTQIAVIYLFYMLTLCLIAILVAIAVGSALSLWATSANLADFKNSLSVLYLQPISEPVILWGLNLPRLLVTCGLVVAIPLLCIFISFSEFTPRTIARHLKRRKK